MTSNILCKDYTELVENCFILKLNLRILDQQLNNCTFRLQLLKEQRLAKCWFSLNLIELRRLTNLVVRSMFELQNATMGKSVNSDYCKYALDQLRYFEFLWRCQFADRILNFNIQFREFINDQNKKKVKFVLEETKKKALLNVWSTNNKRQNSNCKPSLESLGLMSIMNDVQPTLDQAKLQENNSKLMSFKNLDSMKNEHQTEFFSILNNETAELSALVQLETSMRVNQQLMECIRNHILSARHTVLSIYETGQNSLNTIENTARNVELTKKVVKVTTRFQLLRNIIFLILGLLFIVYFFKIIGVLEDLISKIYDKVRAFLT